MIFVKYNDGKIVSYVAGNHLFLTHEMQDEGWQIFEGTTEDLIRVLKNEEEVRE